jgi:hypothetical protein
VIYFVQPRGRPLVKIGHARHVGRRVADLQVVSPDELIVLGVVAGGLAKETALHARFAGQWVRGEWFRYTEEVRRFLQVEAEDYQPDIHDPTPGPAGQLEWEAALAAVRPACPERGQRVRVWVQEFSGRANLMLQWIDPDTRKRRSKSAGTNNRDEAEVRRADLEAALNFRLRNNARNTCPVPSAPSEVPSDATPCQD